MQRVMEDVIVTNGDGEAGSPDLKFRQLFAEVAEDLQFALSQLRDLDHFGSIPCVELSDIVEQTENSSKRLPLGPGIRCWSPLLGNHGIIVCKGLDDVLEASDPNQSCTLGTDELRDRTSGMLTCLIGDLKTWTERQLHRLGETSQHS
jgi:hypothetical protein